MAIGGFVAFWIGREAGCWEGKKDRNGEARYTVVKTRILTL